MGNKHSFRHILMQKLLFCNIPSKSYEMLNIPMHDIIQNNFTEIWAVKECNLCVLLWDNKCSIILLSFHIFIGKGVCHDCAWYDEYLERIYQ